MKAEDIKGLSRKNYSKAVDPSNIHLQVNNTKLFLDV